MFWEYEKPQFYNWSFGEAGSIGRCLSVLDFHLDADLLPPAGDGQAEEREDFDRASHLGELLDLPREKRSDILGLLRQPFSVERTIEEEPDTGRKGNGSKDSKPVENCRVQGPHVHKQRKKREEAPGEHGEGDPEQRERPYVTDLVQERYPDLARVDG